MMETHRHLTNNWSTCYTGISTERPEEPEAVQECGMDTLWGENRPEACLSVGLDCRTCVQRSASSVATLCPGLGSAGAEELFFQIFPAPGCAPMAAAFAGAYAETEVPVR